MTLTAKVLPKRPLALKLAFASAVLGLFIGIGMIVLNREAYGVGWILFLFARIFISIVWLTLLILALNGRNWARYLYSGFSVFGLFWNGYRHPDALSDPSIWFFTIPTLLAALLFFLPQCNNWYETVRSKPIHAKSPLSET